MSKKKILIVTYVFYPENSPRAFRATELAKELIRQGHEVTVYAPETPGVEELLKEYPIRFKSMGKMKWRVPLLAGQSELATLFNRLMVRSLKLFLEFPLIELFFKVSKHLRQEEKDYDLLISIAVPFPIHWGVAAVWRKGSAANPAKVWVADCGDPYMGQENDTFRPPFYFGWVEKWFCRKADYLTVPTPTSYRGYYPEFHSKIKVIPQGFRFEDVATAARKSDDGKVRFGYGGSFIPGRRDPRELLALLTTLPHEYEFHIYTENKDLVEPYAVLDSRIVLHDPIPRLELLKQFSSFDFVINFGNKGTAQTPSKLIDYAIINKPILQIETGALDEEAVINFLTGDYSRAFRVENPDQYRIDHVVKQFLALAP
ncbi:glycosyltransferase [Rhodoflexus caldus]|uniref:glycosyltransferase n=1 Tax=Rhodoflexus caldus TaxID=2891236 RepID=UPI00202AB65C|nr:glycosyltransferase [Rhodoflexus caldus]